MGHLMLRGLPRTRRWRDVVGLLEDAGSDTPEIAGATALAAGCEAHDPEDGYETDLLTGEGQNPTERAMLEGYVSHATKVEGIEDPTVFFTEFPEAYRAVNAMGGDCEETAGKVFELCKRQTAQVNRVVDGVLTRLADEGTLRKRGLLSGCLSELVQGMPPSSRTAEQESRGTEGQHAVHSLDGEWVGPMSKAEMARRVLNHTGARWRKVSSMFPDSHVSQVTDRTFRFRIDSLDAHARKRCKGDEAPN